jgi:lipopolysaccharide biosynthesis regulator YciM
MRRQHASWAAAALVLLALVAQTHRAHDRLLASKTLLRAEQETLASSATGHLDPIVLRTNLARLRQAERWDPTEVRIPIAIGTMHLLLHHPRDAVDAYRAALKVEERYEIYQNLAEAQHRAGDAAGARQSEQTALKLAPFLSLQRVR